MPGDDCLGDAPDLSDARAMELEVTFQIGTFTHGALGVSGLLAALLDITSGCCGVDHDRR